MDEQAARERWGDADAEFRGEGRCNHHPEVQGDCEADHQAISTERVW